MRQAASNWARSLLQSCSKASRLNSGLRTLCNASANAQHVDCVVVGAGVVGLAVARALALAGREVVILDSHSAFGAETSSRNSEVIHAGLYYPPGSLKSRMCIEGNQALYDFCRQRSIPHKNTQKLVVASNKEQLGPLRALHERAQACGARSLSMISREEAVSLELQLHCEAALLSPSSGILDSHSYMATLLADAESAGAVMGVASRVLRGKVLDRSSSVSMSSSDSSGDGSSGSQTDQGGSTSGGEQQRGWAGSGWGGIVLEVEDLQSQERVELHASTVVNSAGIGAQSLSRSIEGIPHSSIPPLYLAKGNYFTLAGGSVGRVKQQQQQQQEASGSGTQAASPSSSEPLFSRLIYPMPPASGSGLGIHLTLDMGGGLRFGPDVEHIQQVDYSVDPCRGPAFEEAVRSYWPALPAGSLVPGYAGIRPKLSAPGTPAADFLVQGPEQHGVSGLACLYGIESPGLTASLVLGEHVKRMLC